MAGDILVANLALATGFIGLSTYTDASINDMI